MKEKAIAFLAAFSTLSLSHPGAALAADNPFKPKTAMDMALESMLPALDHFVLYSKGPLGKVIELSVLTALISIGVLLIWRAFLYIIHESYWVTNNSSGSDGGIKRLKGTSEEMDFLSMQGFVDDLSDYDTEEMSAFNEMMGLEGEASEVDEADPFSLQEPERVLSIDEGYMEYLQEMYQEEFDEW